MFGWIMLFLFFIMILSFIIYDWVNSDKYCDFLTEVPLIGDFLWEHDFAFFAAAFWTTALPIVGLIWAFIRMIFSIIELFD